MKVSSYDTVCDNTQVINIARVNKRGLMRSWKKSPQEVKNILIPNLLKVIQIWYVYTHFN